VSRASVDKSKRYDADEACYLYEVYVSVRGTPGDDEILSRLIDSLSALVNTVCSTEISRSVCDYNFDVMRLEALEALFLIIKEGVREIPFDTPNRFTRFLWSTIKHEIYRSATVNSDSVVIDFSQVCGSSLTAPAIYGTTLSYHDVDNKFRLYEFNRDVLQYAVDKIRFLHKEKEACVAILKLMTKSKVVDPAVVAMHYNISRDVTCFLVKYCRFLLRRSRYLLGASIAFE
jgi:hypothetical protein